MMMMILNTEFAENFFEKYHVPLSHDYACVSSTPETKGKNLGWRHPT
jgi:hypothetical protein